MYLSIKQVLALSPFFWIMVSTWRGDMTHSRSPRWSVMDPDHALRTGPSRDTTLNHLLCFFPQNSEHLLVRGVGNGKISGEGDKLEFGRIKLGKE